MSRARSTALRPQRVWSTDAPQLSRQLADFERGVEAESRRLAALLVPRFSVRDEESGNVQVRIWEAVRVSAATAARVALLPDASPGEAGSVVAVIVTDATNNVTVSSVASADVNGAASATLSAVGAYLFLWDGSAWWRVV